MHYDLSTLRFSRRELLGRAGSGLGILGLAGLLNDSDGLRGAESRADRNRNPLAARERFPDVQRIADALLAIYTRQFLEYWALADPSPEGLVTSMAWRCVPHGSSRRIGDSGSGAGSQPPNASSIA